MTTHRRGSPTMTVPTPATVRSATAATLRSALDRPLAGRTVLAIAAIHAAAAPALYPDSLRSIRDGGVIAAVESEPSLVDLRGVGFWYLTSGFLLALVGGAVHHLERRGEGLPRWVGWGLVAVATWGAMLMPRSGFWAIAVAGALAIRRSAAP